MLLSNDSPEDRHLNAVHGNLNPVSGNGEEDTKKNRIDECRVNE